MAGLWRWRYSIRGRHQLNFQSKPFRGVDSEAPMLAAIVVLTVAIVVAVCAVAIWVDAGEKTRTP